MAVFGVAGMGMVPSNWLDSWYETGNGSLGGRDKPESYYTRNFGSLSEMASVRVGMRVGIGLDMYIQMVIQIS